MRFFITFLFTCTALFADIFDFETISSKFTQTITNEENSKIVYTGSFYATKANKALWIYKTPVEKSIYINKEQVIILEPELEQAIVTNLKSTPNIADILKSSKEVKKDMYTTTYDDTQYDIHVKEGKIAKLAYKDKLENSVVIEFYDQSINAVLDDVLFKVTIPSDFDIVTQ